MSDYVVIALLLLYTLCVKFWKIIFLREMVRNCPQIIK